MISEYNRKQATLYYLQDLYIWIVLKHIHGNDRNLVNAQISTIKNGNSSEWNAFNVYSIIVMYLYTYLVWYGIFNAYFM